MPEITSEYLASQGLSPTFPQRFWSKVNKTESCWIWTGALVKGYGEVRPFRAVPCIKSHRAAWILCVGPIPDGLWVLHNCPGGDNPACVNPNHLWLGTAADNSADRDAKGRHWTRVALRGVQRHNHKLTPEAAEIIRNEYGKSSGRELAKRFNVSHAAIRSCVIGRTWRVID